MAWGAWLELPRTLLSAVESAVTFGASYTDVHARFPFIWATLVVLAAGAGLSLWYGFSRRGVAAAAGDWAVRRGDDGRRPVRRYPAALDRHAERAGQGTAVHRPQHRGHAARLRARPRRGARAVGRRGADAAGHHQQRRHDRERAAVGPPAAAADVRADPGDPHLLRLHQRRQRPLHDRRQVPAGDAVGARAELREHPEPIVGQRAADVHARLRAHARTGESGDDRGAAGAVRPRPAAGVDRKICASISRASTSASSRTTTRSCARSQPEFHYPRGDDNETTFYEGTGGVPVGGFLRRLLFAIRFANTDILVTNQIATREPDPLPPAHCRSRAADRAVSDVRFRSVPGRQQRPDLLDPGRVHDHRELSVFHAVGVPRRTVQLHPQFREDRRRRVQRDDDVLPRGAAGPAGADDRQ